MPYLCDASREAAKTAQAEATDTAVPGSVRSPARPTCTRTPSAPFRSPILLKTRDPPLWAGDSQQRAENATPFVDVLGQLESDEAWIRVRNRSAMPLATRTSRARAVPYPEIPSAFQL